MCLVVSMPIYHSLRLDSNMFTSYTISATSQAMSSTIFPHDFSSSSKVYSLYICNPTCHKRSIFLETSVSWKFHLSDPNLDPLPELFFLDFLTLVHHICLSPSWVESSLLRSSVNSKSNN